VRRSRTAAAALALGALAFAGCGSSGGGAYTVPTGPVVKTVAIESSNFRFKPSKISVPAGVIKIDLTSTDGSHSLVIEGIPGFMVEADSGGSGTGKVKLSKGKYTFYCNVPGHRASGMVGTITVG
jgi:plastocyanin